MTAIINLFGGPGSGKSVAAAEVYASLSRAGKKVELVREYIKDWVWEGRKRFFMDQVYVLAKQMRKEQVCLGQVDYIVTDSPVLLSAFYEDKYGNNSATLTEIIFKYQDEISTEGHTQHNFFMSRGFKYVEAGRYQTEEEARQIDTEMKTFCDHRNVKYCTAVDSFEISRLFL
jgi:hypothetical protein